VRPASSSRYAWVIVANTLSAARLICAGLFPFIPADHSHWRLALVVFAAATDLIDGQIARRMHAQTRLGQALDAVADKAVALVVILTLAVEGALGWGWVALLASRDIAVLVATLVLFRKHRMEASHHMSHHWSGKVATAAAFALLVGLLAWPSPPKVMADVLHRATEPAWRETLRIALLLLAAATSVFAGVRIFWRLPGMVRERETGRARGVAEATSPISGERA
jgi:phosphatidylglycerophosphate synthase